MHSRELLLIATLALLVLGAPQAVAQDKAPAPRLKELVAVSSEIVRIGDLVENAGAASGIPVFRAPDLGHTGSVPAARCSASDLRKAPCWTISP